MAGESLSNGDSIQRIQKSKNFKNAIEIAFEDGKFDVGELEAIYKRYDDVSKLIGELFERGCNITKKNTQIGLNSLKCELGEGSSEFIISIVKYYPYLAFKYFKEFKDQPWAKDFLIEASKERPYLALEYFKEFKDQPWAKDTLIEASKKDPYSAFKCFKEFKDQPWAKDTLIEAIEINPYGIFEFLNNYKDESWAKDVLIEASKINPYSAFEYFKKFKDQPWARDVLIGASKKGPYSAFDFLNNYKDESWANEVINIAKSKDVLIEASKKGPDLAFTHFDYYKDQPWARDILIEASKKGPDSAFTHFDYYKDQPWARDILIEATKISPYFAFKYFKEFKDQPWARDILIEAKSKNILIEATKEEPLYAFTYFDYYKDQPWARDILIEASKISPYLAFEYFKEFKDQPWARDILKTSYETIKNSDSKDYLKIAYIISEFHLENDEIRFMIIDSRGSNDLYKLINRGREEIFTSTYNGIVNRLLISLKKEGKDIYDVASENNFEGVAIFLETATSYSRFKELFGTIKSTENKKILIQKLVESVELDLIRNSVALMETIENLEDRESLNYIGDLIKEKYEKGGDFQKAFGIIGKFGSKYFKDPFFQKLPNEYNLPEKIGIPSKELFDKSGRNVQQYFFYNDEDGKTSFDNFISNYKKDGNWKIETMGSFVKVSSKSKNGKQIIIFANKPEFDGEKDGSKDIQNEMSKFNPPLESIVIVHRGHSYHAQKTIDKIPPIAKMVFLGSCGGFQNIGKTLEKSPDAHIISTKGTGTKLVNDPLFKSINDTILSGNDVVWKGIWENISKKIGNNSDFRKYVRPDKNLGVLFSNKYNSKTE